MSIENLITKKYFTDKLISTGKEYQYCPYNIGQQKMLLIAKEESENDILKVFKALMQMMMECTKDLDIINLYTIDFEKLFLNLRNVSEGNIVKLVSKCPNKKCDNEIEYEIDLKKDLNIIKDNSKFNSFIKLEEDNLILNVDYLTMKDLITIEKCEYNSEVEKSLITAAYHIKNVVKKDEMVELTLEDKIDLINSFSTAYFKKLLDYVNTTPKIKFNKKLVCEKCSAERDLSDEINMNFFF